MKNKKKIIIALIVLLAIVLGVLIFIIIRNFTVTNYDDFINDTTTQETSSADISSPTDTSTNATQPPKVDNPINFDEIQAINKDAYAWITVPNTNIDYPILQSSTEDDLFYLEHNIYKEYEFAGSIYTEKLNSRDFLDPNTVIYGHDMLNGSMFQNLHSFSDPEFFDENEFFYIYTPTRKLTYQIFSAYIYDNRHILNSFDFSDEEVFEQYIEDSQNPKSVDTNTRDNIEITTNDKIVTLSTCVGYDKGLRYLVQGVLIKDEQTK